MSDKLQMALALSALGLLLVEEERKTRRVKIRRNRTKWVKSWTLQRQAHGAFPNLCRELETNATSVFKNFVQLFPVQFHVLKELVSPIIQRQNTNCQDCISVGERLMITLRFLATDLKLGETQASTKHMAEQIQISFQSLMDAIGQCITDLISRFDASTDSIETPLKGDTLLLNNTRIYFYPDYSAELSKQRREFDPIKRKLWDMNIDYSLLYPSVLRFKYGEEKPRLFRNPKDAEDFMREMERCRSPN
ncbi:hypothetical protein ABVT39_005941 [Epinephelus coioides]